MNNGYFYETCAPPGQGNYPRRYPPMFGMNGHPQQYPPQIHDPMGHPEQHRMWGRNGYHPNVAQYPQTYGPMGHPVQQQTYGLNGQPEQYQAQTYGHMDYPVQQQTYGLNGQPQQYQAQTYAPMSYHPQQPAQQMYGRNGPHQRATATQHQQNFGLFDFTPTFHDVSDYSEEEEVEYLEEAETPQSKVGIDAKELAELKEIKEKYTPLLKQSAGSKDATSKLKDLSLDEGPLPKDSFAKVAMTKPKSDEAPLSKPVVSRGEIVRQLGLQTSKPAKGRKVPELTQEEVDKWVYTQLGVSEKADLCLHYYKRPRPLKKDAGVGVAPNSLYALQEGCTKVASGKKCYHTHSLIVCKNSTLKELSSLKQVRDLLKISFKVMAVQGIPPLDFNKEYKELQDRWLMVHGQAVEAKATPAKEFAKRKPAQRTAEQEKQDDLNQTRDKPLRNYRAHMSNDEFITDEELVREEKLIMRMREDMDRMLGSLDDSAEYARGSQAAQDLAALARDPKNKLALIAIIHANEVRSEMHARLANLDTQVEHDVLHDNELDAEDGSLREEDLVEQLKVRLRRVLTFPEGSSEYKDGIKAGAEIVARCKDSSNRLSHIAKTGRHAIEQEVNLVLDRLLKNQRPS
ncbi:hypothetical protein Vi05172_g10368 [Venturia inaequalis]|nr:hypothetical protein Vi05172_g10368 [Venturia inaequalis]